MMIRSSALLFLAVGTLLTVYATELLEVVTKKRDFPEASLSIERTYRGEQCIQMEMIEKGKKARAFAVNGKTVMAESDEDGDGFFESFMIFDTDTGDFEWFSRTTNGVVRPVSSQRLQEARSKKKAADKALFELIRKH